MGPNVIFNKPVVPKQKCLCLDQGFITRETCICLPCSTENEKHPQLFRTFQTLGPFFSYIPLMRCALLLNITLLHPQRLQNVMLDKFKCRSCMRQVYFIDRIRAVCVLKNGAYLKHVILQF